MAPHQHHGQHGHGADEGAAELIEMLDLDAELTASFRAEALDWIAAHLPAEPRHIVDLGSGTGTGTFALLGRFGAARVTAVDASAEMIRHLRRRAGELGLVERVATVHADLDEGWPAVDAADLVWAAASLHHLADPDRVLADIRATLSPGGTLAVVEMDGLPRFLPQDLGRGRPGLEDRCHVALAEQRTHLMSNLGADWGVLLERCGFTVRAQRRFDIELGAPLPPSAGRYAELTLGRMRDALGDSLAADDLVTLDALVDDGGPDGVAHRDDLTLRSHRPVWLASPA